MNNKTKKAAKTFIKAVKGEINYVSAGRFACNELKYTIILFNTPNGDIEISRYNLHEKAEKNKAFTYCSAAHLIFIDNKSSGEDKLYLLLHEIGHILLKHVGNGDSHEQNKILLDIEADAFVYTVLNYQNKNNITPLIVAIMKQYQKCINHIITVIFRLKTMFLLPQHQLLRRFLMT